MRTVFAALLLALSACGTAPPPPHIYPEAELAPGHILAPIRAAMGDMWFTNARAVSDTVTEVEGYRADGAYRFEVTNKGDRWELTRTERVGDAPPSP